MNGIPGFGKGALPPSAHEADSFLEEVDEVTRLVDGLRSGKVSAEYVDRVLKEKDEESAKVKVQAREKEEESEKNAYDNLPEEKKKAMRAKVADMIREKERRERARELYAERQDALTPEERAKKSVGRSATPTDYRSWDLWTPSDDEEDPWMQYTPENPAFKAMERDIDQRHEKRVRQRQTAHRKREEGNVALKRGQYAEALKIYESGLEFEKRSIELHGNAALAALKSGCFAQTIEHCDQACDLADFFLEKPNHPTAIKCLLRRAAAREALGHFVEAVADLESAAGKDPGDSEIEKRLIAARRRRDDAKAARALRRRPKLDEGEAIADDESESEYFAVGRFETFMRRVRDADARDADDSDYESLARLLRNHESCRVFARGEDGFGIATLASRLDFDEIGAAKALVAACVSESNCECLVSNSDRVEAVLAFATRHAESLETFESLETETGARNLDAVFHALEILRECSRYEVSRKAVAAGFAKDARGADPFAVLKAQLRVPASIAVSNPMVARNLQSALTVFGNVALDPGGRATARLDFSKPPNPPNLPEHDAKRDAQRDDGFGRFPRILTRWIRPEPRVSRVSRLDEITRLATIAVGNACVDSEFRAALTGIDTELPKRLILALPAFPKDANAELPELTELPELPELPKLRGLPKLPKLGGSFPVRATGASRTPEVFLDEVSAVESFSESIFAALSNVLLDPLAFSRSGLDADEVVDAIIPRLARSKGCDAATVSVARARAALALARFAREPSVVSRLRRDGGSGGAVAVARFINAYARDAARASVSASALEAGTRTLALVFAGYEKDGQIGSPAEAAAARTSYESSVLAVCAEVSATLADAIGSGISETSDGIVGNAALIIGDLARNDSALRVLEKSCPALIPSLLTACRERAGPAQKNAAIACARLARYPPFARALKDHHGLALIYAYVKP